MEQEIEKILDEKNKSFNPNENGLYHNGIFGLPFKEKESKIVLVPVPWEGTVSYKTGTFYGPEAILKSSQQIDLFDLAYPDFWQKGIAYAENYFNFKKIHKKNLPQIKKYLKEYSINKINQKRQNKIKEHSLLIKKAVQEKTAQLLKENKFIGLVGGEHSINLGYLENLAQKYNSFGILQIDAHADLRENYEGLEYSHASIFHNILKIKNVEKLVQIGVRDISPIEAQQINNDSRIKTFYDAEIKKALLSGESYLSMVQKIIAELPDSVYISFDIDSLDPVLCPNTGTPVPGGFSFNEIDFLLNQIVLSNKKIIGFDLVEVAPGKDDWDGNVGARLLYKLCLYSAKTF